MDTTWGYLVVVFLGMRVETGPIPNCEARGAQWLHAAIAWHERTGVEGNLLYMCEPAAPVWVVRAHR